MGQTYKEAGVDIAAAEAAVKEISDLAKSTFSPNVISNVGGFGAQYLFPSEKYSQPVLISSTDGVGTKSLVASDMGRFDTIGEDLVNHCVDDILTTGAEPLFFLDYIGVGKLNLDEIKSLVSGFAKACKETGCSLIGGEMAEMPEIYGNRHVDVVGTITGVVEREKTIDGSKIKSGDVVIGLKSNGLHTNGYTLARSVLLNEFSLDAYNDDLSCTIGEELLRVHRSYLASIKPLLQKDIISGLAHITGGGIEGNTNRIMPEGCSLSIHWDLWEEQAIFELIMKLGDIPLDDMRTTFNMGIGYTLICDAEDADSIVNSLDESGERATIIGEVS